MSMPNVAAIAALIWSVPLAAGPSLITVELKPATLQAFERYIQEAEARQEARTNFLWVDEAPERRRQARGGGIVIEPLSGKGDVEIPGGLVHDWIGTVFLPRASLEKTLRLVRDYGRHKQIYGEVADSRILHQDGDTYRIFLRLTRKKVITVVLNTEHEVRYVRAGPQRWRSQSHSTRITEVENPGTPRERELPAGRDHGFLWRLYSYWRFEESDGGVFVECRAISLTRDVPTGLGWLIQPVIRSLPRESLTSTLQATRAAVRRIDGN